MSQKLEIWTTTQKWMTMNENVKKEEKNNEKNERKMKKTEKAKTKKITNFPLRDLKFGPQLRSG